MNKGLSITYILIMLCLCPALLSPAQSSSSSADNQEVYLSFRHRGAVNQMISSYYDSKSQTFYLPVTSLFNALGIDYKINQDRLTVSGSYINTGATYRMDFQQQYLSFQDRRIKLSADDYLVKELDFYLKPKLFEQLLDLRFNIDFSSLTLSLESDYTMPVVAEIQRKRRRQQEMEELSVRRDDFPLKYRREQSFLDGFFLDYNLSSNFTNDLNLYTYNINSGVELLAGDMQGSISGSWSQFNSSFNTNNLRWRYVMRDNEWLNRIRVGQSVTEGIQSRSFTGLKLSNEPIEPRISFDEYVVQGQTRPQSEVELYLNNSLIDFQEADELGNYRFVIPLTYGSSRLRVRIYGPDGGIREFNRRILVPFNFQKPGEFRYSVSAGRLDRRIFGTSDRGYVVQSEGRVGVNRNLTVGGGLEYLQSAPTTHPLFYGTISSRVFTNYLINADIAPNAFYRLRTNTVYASSAGWGIDYTYYPSDNFYNRTGNDHEISGNFFVPFSIGNTQFNTRLFTSHRRGPGSNTTRYRFDLNTRISSVTVRAGFSDQQLGGLDLTTTSSSRLTSSFTYTLPRGGQMPTVLSGIYLRGQLDYSMYAKTFQRAGIQLSRNISQTGRLRVSFDRSFTGGYNSVNVGLSFNFNKTRSNSTFRTNQGDVSYTQSLRGTIGYDSHNHDFVLDNRQQVGRSAASVRLFVDENNNSTYEEGEKVIKDNAVQLRRSGSVDMAKDGTIHLMQLQSYNRLNAHINQSAITNPLYIPEVEEFSFIADPNQFKPINIPFYQSGVISGKVFRMQSDTSAQEPVAGLRLQLTQVEGDFSKEMRTFSDGGFYTMEIPPGRYRLSVDDSQLDFLNVTSNPPVRKFKVEAKANGDFVEKLNFTLKPRKDTTQQQQIAKQKSDTTSEKTRSSQKESVSKSKGPYGVQLAAYNNTMKAVRIMLDLQNYTDPSDNILTLSRDRLISLKTNSMNPIDQALYQLARSKQSNFPDAFLTQHLAPETDTTSYYVQLAAFDDRSNAREFLNSARSSVRQILQISSKQTTLKEEGTRKQLFAVHTHPTRTWRQAASLKDSIRANTPFNSAFLEAKMPAYGPEMITFDKVLVLGPFSADTSRSALQEIKNKYKQKVNIPGKSSAGSYLMLQPITDGPTLRELQRGLSAEYPELNQKTVLLKIYRRN